ncbi:hypothetical protein DL770_008899 [Monosporascus sp. CRB-9-2]|nr:hypothetical protein DL770_008899 [Monosporascus sp. CRB-9-2]
METFQTLPLEIFTKVLSFLPAIEDVMNVAITNRFNYQRVRGSESYIVHQVLINQLDVDPLAICVARYAAATAPWKYSKDIGDAIAEDQDDYLKKIMAFGEQYLSKQATKLLLPARAFTLKMASSIISFDVCAFRIAERIATGILTDKNTDLTPRPTEIARVKRSLYILDIIGHILHSTPFTLEEHRGHDPARQNTAFTKFWLNFAPWECAQVQGLEWIMMDLIDGAYVAKHGGIPVPNKRRVDMKHARQLMLILGVEALEPLVVRQEFPAAWEDLYATLQQEDRKTADNRRYEKITEVTYEDYFRWFDLSAVDQTQGDVDEYETTIDAFNIDGYDATNDTGARDAWFWQLNRFWGILVHDPVFYEAGNEWDVGDWEYSPHQVLWWDRERMEEVIEIPSFEDMMEVLKENVLVVTRPDA